MPSCLFYYKEEKQMGSMTIEIENNLGKDVDASFVDGKICLNWVETKRRLGDLNPGDVFKDESETEYIVCGHEHFVTYVIRRELLNKKNEIRGYE